MKRWPTQLLVLLGALPPLDAIKFAPATTEKWLNPDLFEQIQRGQCLPASSGECA